MLQVALSLLQAFDFLLPSIVCQTLFAIGCGEFELGSNTTQLIVFTLALRFEILPVVAIFLVIHYNTQTVNFQYNFCYLKTTSLQWTSTHDVCYFAPKKQKPCNHLDTE